MSRRLVIVTGASRGIGAEIAMEAHRRFKETPTLLLISRNQDLLNETKSKILTSSSSDTSSSAIHTLRIDFSIEVKVSDYVNMLKSSLGGGGSGDDNLTHFDELYVFYNHGTLKIGSIDELAESASQEFITNVTSVWLFLSAVRKVFTLETIPRQFHINMSSLMATKTTNSMSVYCAS